MTNYFDFYGLPVKFNLDDKELKAKYFKLLKSQHPDFFINDFTKYQEALITSSLNNEAYKCLSDFYTRAQHILSLSNMIFDENLPSDFLMEMMEINESLDDLEASSDGLKLEEIKEEIKEIQTRIENELRDLSIKADHFLLESEVLYNGIKQNLLKYKYVLRLNETLANIAAP